MLQYKDNERQVPTLWEPVFKLDAAAEGRLPVLQYPSLKAHDFVEHFFTTRKGGVSTGIFDSLNLSFSRGDDSDHVMENYRRVAAVFGKEPGDIVCSDQTHTTNVRRVTAEDGGRGVTREKGYTDVDGLITSSPGLILATFYADCVPLFIVDPVHRAIGLSHSGWRGTVGRMGKATLDAMAKEFGTRPGDVSVAIGPSICKDCYEVSLDVAEAFMKEFSKDGHDAGDILTEKAPVDGERKFLLDLWRANERVFLEAGVPAGQIEKPGLCTCCNPDILFSHRASKGKRGNLGAFMMIR